jgi:hypothetical protein
VVPLFGDRKPYPYLHTEFTEGQAKLSPNGQWLAYRSDESKRGEIYVQTFPTPGGKWQVSTNGESTPRVPGTPSALVPSLDRFTRRGPDEPFFPARPTFESISMGSGNTTVVFFSEPISTSVCK